jgi:hypothetical protein
VGTRAICRRERPHPGAAHKIGFTDHTGHRFRVFITNQPDPDAATLDARHHAQRPAQAAGRATSATAALEVGHRARVEDRIRAAKATGLANLPFSDFDANDVWLTLVLVAQTLVAWAQALLLDGELARAEPKTLRYRLWHAAARLVRHARRVSCASTTTGRGPQRCWPPSRDCGPCHGPPAADHPSADHPHHRATRCYRTRWMVTSRHDRVTPAVRPATPMTRHALIGRSAAW